MKKKIFYLLLIYAIKGIAQKEDNNWIIGVGQFDLGGSIYRDNLIYFDHDSFHVQLLNRSIPFFGAMAIVSDTSGHLQCFSNGINVYNRYFEIMINGAEFQLSSKYVFGYPFDQSVLILPLPDTIACYLMIDGNQKDIVIDVVTLNLRYSVIDVLGGNGYGVVVEKMKTVENSSDTLNIGFLTAVRHENGKDWWVLTTKYETNQYRKFLVTKTGIHYQDDQQIGELVHNGIGSAAFSPSGCWYARYLAYGQTIDPKSALYLYRFDRSVGELSEPLFKMYPPPEVYGGVAFSPNSRYLYVGRITKIYQYDLQAADILGSETVVAEYDGFLDEQGVPTQFYGLQLAPDGKIYGNVPGFNTRYLHVIDQPDLPGAACNVIQHAIYLPAQNFGTLPNLPYYRLGAAGAPCDSIVDAMIPAPAADAGRIRVWPVPAADVLYFSAETAREEPLRLLLFDALGRIALEQPALYLSPTATVRLDALLPGAYYYTLRSKNGKALNSGKVIRTQ